METKHKQTINTFAIQTLGCKVNLFESNIIKNDFLLNGLVQVPFKSVADVYVINTCSVTNKADAKSRMFIRNAYKNNHNAIIIVAGCLSQIDLNLAKQLKIDIQIGNKYKNSVYDLLTNYLKNKERIIKIENLIKEKKFEVVNNISFKENTRAFIKIQDGCNFYCSYCIIPFARGKQRSNKLESIIKEIKNLVKQGYLEIVLTGVNTAGYFDENHHNFYDLLKAIDNLKGNFRIRISSVEPFQITDEIINLIALNPNRFCQHWHICLQSGSNHVLKQMHRKYTNKEFKTLINKIKKLNPNTIFTTDYIVGFPTESEKDHLSSLTFLKQIKFFDMHIFPYSKRNGTTAAKLNNIEAKIVKQRINEVSSLNFAIKWKILKSKINHKLQVIFEDLKNTNSLYIHGYSNEYIKVYVKRPSFKLSNKIYDVKTIKVFNDGLLAELI